MISRRIERAMPPLGHFVDIDGARMHFVDRGSGTPVVMIHGLASVLNCFTHSLLDRVATQHRAIAIDRPGSGYSVRKKGTPAALREQAAAIAHFIRAQHIERPLIVGHSLGGAIALALALDFPAIPRALALIAPLTQPELRPPKPFRALQIESPWVRSLVAHTVALPLSILSGPKAVAQVFAPEAVPADFPIAAGGLLGLRPSQFYNAASDLIAARDDMRSIVERYGELRLPVHVLFGTEDAVLDYRRHAETLRSQIAHVDLTLVSGGHMLPITQPEFTSSWISSVLGV